MCTLIASLDDHFILGMNRDEVPERRHNSYHHAGDIFYPVDPAHNGTWIGVAKDGSVAALLNGQGNRGTRSRGEIVPYALQNGGVTELDFSQYGPLVLFHFKTQERSMTVSVWDGARLNSYAPDNPVVLCSSRYGVAERRKGILTRLSRATKIDKNSLSQLLRSHNPERGIISTCMHGPKSETVASTIIEIAPQEVCGYDVQGSPCGKDYKQILQKTVL